MTPEEAVANLWLALNQQTVLEENFKVGLYKSQWERFEKEGLDMSQVYLFENLPVTPTCCHSVSLEEDCAQCKNLKTTIQKRPNIRTKPNVKLKDIGTLYGYMGNTLQNIILRVS